MEYGKIFKVDYDYELALLLSENTETLIGGSAKALKKALKNTASPDLSVKDLNIFLHEQPLGTFAFEVCNHSDKIEDIEGAANLLYANLIDKHTTGKKVVEPLDRLEMIYTSEKNNAVRLLAMVVLKWYDKATRIYMDSRYGLGLKQAERALLGEQFRSDVNDLIKDEFTTLKKKKSPQDTEISNVIIEDSRDISTLLLKYYRYLNSRKIFLNNCKRCHCIFLSGAKNTCYCADCKISRKKISREKHSEKYSEGVRSKRQKQKYMFENFIHKNKAWDSYSDEFKGEYQALRKEFVQKTARLIKRLKNEENEELISAISDYVDKINSERSSLEGKAH